MHKRKVKTGVCACEWGGFEAALTRGILPIDHPHKSHSNTICAGEKRVLRKFLPVATLEALLNLAMVVNMEASLEALVAHALRAGATALVTVVLG